MKQVRALIHILKTDQNMNQAEKTLLLHRIEGKLNFISFIRSKKIGHIVFYKTSLII